MDTCSPPVTHYVKFRTIGTRRWFFVDPRGEGTLLRIKAARFPSAADAQSFIERRTPDNSHLEFKPVVAGSEAR